jgi:hypothetical protein
MLYKYACKLCKVIHTVLSNEETLVVINTFVTFALGSNKTTARNKQQPNRRKVDCDG